MMKFGSIPANTMVFGPRKKIVVTTGGSTVNLDITSGDFAVWTTNQAQTVNAVGTQQEGQRLELLVKFSALATLTFGTGFKANGTLSGLLNKTATFVFMSDGTNFFEQSRTASL